MRNMRGILAGVSLGIGAAYSVGLVVVAIILLLPGLLAMMLDASENRLLGRSVLFPSIAASLSPLYTVLRLGGGATGALTVLSDPAVVGLAWAAAGFGWLMVEATTGMARLMLEANVRQRRNQLEAQREKLKAEWGTPDPAA